MRLWDVEKGVTIKRLEGHKDTVLCIAFSPDGRHAVSGSTDTEFELTGEWPDGDAPILEITVKPTSGDIRLHRAA